VSPSGDAPDLDEEFRRVAVIAASDDLVGARTALRRLADRAVESGRPSAASRALRLSAALDRVLGDSADAARARHTDAQEASGWPSMKPIYAATVTRSTRARRRPR